MTKKSPSPELRPVAITPAQLAALPPGPLELQMRVVTAADAWLDASYELLAAQFDRSVLDSRESYAELLQGRQKQTRAPLFMMAAYVPQGRDAALVGVISGNLMPLQEYAGPNPHFDRPAYLFAIGHQVTSRAVREAGRRGVGGHLFQSALDEAQAEVMQRGGVLRYAFAEAENDSLGFWTKVGFRWPRGVRYWQPPLDFDAEGSYVLAEVPEVLLLRPLEGVPEEQIDRILLENIIAAVYLDWTVAKWSEARPPAVLARIRDYVMGVLFGRLCARMPANDPLSLVSLKLPEDRATHRRTIALAEGIQHGLEPIPMLPPGTDISKLGLGEREAVLPAMLQSDNARIVLAISGQDVFPGPSIAALLERRQVHAVILDSAALDLALCAERGAALFRLPADRRPDSWLLDHGYNRTGDLVVTQYAVDELQDLAMERLSRLPWEQSIGSAEVIARMSGDGHGGMLEEAARAGVPVFVPDFSSSLLGVALAMFNQRHREAHLPTLHFDPFLDLEHYRAVLAGGKSRGVIVLNDGPARTWAGQGAVIVDAVQRRENALAFEPLAFRFAVRIAPTGGRSLSEEISRGVLIPPEDGGRSAEIVGCPNMFFPSLVEAL